MKLGNCTDIRSGLVLSRKLSKIKTDHRYKLLNLRSINNDTTINMETLDVFDSIEELNTEYITRKNDVIIRMSAPYTAVLITEKEEGLLIPSYFVIIRTDNKSFLPEFLYWYLNREQVKKRIVKNSGKNMLGAIRPQFFAELKIPEIPIQKQEILAGINILAKEEEKLIKQLLENKRKFYQTELNKIYKDFTK